eukprot:ANDGO_00110.mRNA.1 hypothetical protein
MWPHSSDRRDVHRLFVFPPIGRFYRWIDCLQWSVSANSAVDGNVQLPEPTTTLGVSTSERKGVSEALFLTFHFIHTLLHNAYSWYVLERGVLPSPTLEWEDVEALILSCSTCLLRIRPLAETQVNSRPIESCAFEPLLDLQFKQFQSRHSKAGCCFDSPRRPRKGKPREGIESEKPDVSLNISSDASPVLPFLVDLSTSYSIIPRSVATSYGLVSESNDPFAMVGSTLDANESIGTRWGTLLGNFRDFRVDWISDASSLLVHEGIWSGDPLARSSPGVCAYSSVVRFFVVDDITPGTSPLIATDARAGAAQESLQSPSMFPVSSRDCCVPLVLGFNGFRPLELTDILSGCRVPVRLPLHLPPKEEQVVFDSLSWDLGHLSSDSHESRALSWKILCQIRRSQPHSRGRLWIYQGSDVDVSTMLEARATPWIFPDDARLLCEPM